MFRIIRTCTFAALTERAAQVPALTAEADQLRRSLETARGEASRLRGEIVRLEKHIEAITQETGRKLGWVIRAARHPDSGQGIQGAIALEMAREIIARAKASGDPQAIADVRVMDAILGEDWPAEDAGKELVPS